MIRDRFMTYPFCRQSCIYIASYIFFTSINCFWIYIITYNVRGYINFGQNDPTIKFILSMSIIIITAIMARCGCICDTLTIDDNNFLSYKTSQDPYLRI